MKVNARLGMKVYALLAVASIALPGAISFQGPCQLDWRQRGLTSSCRSRPTFALKRTDRSTKFDFRRNVASTPQQPDIALDSSVEQFKFTKQWYPIAVTEFLDPKKPHPVQLLGKDLVMWKDVKSGQWKVFDDACPHRLVPLSEGRVEPDGTLLCSYHAWRFNGDGKCTTVPQSVKEQEEQILANPRSCATPYPTTERQGLLWVWGEPGGPGSDAAIMSKLRPPAIIPELEDPALVGRLERLTWSIRDLPYGWDYFMENVMDSGHVVVSHHGLVGNRYTLARPYDMPLVKEASPQGGFAYDVVQLPKGGGEEGTSQTAFPGVVGAQVIFDPPSSLRIRNNFADGGALLLCLFATPTVPGYCRHIGCQVLIKNNKGKWPPGLAFFTLPMPVWLQHILASLFLHQDMVFLHHQEKILARRGYENRAGPSSAIYGKETFVVNPQDRMILAFRSWLKNMAGGGVPWAAGSPELPRRERDEARLFDVYHSHTKNCAYCTSALRNLKKIRIIAAAAAVLTAALSHGPFVVAAAAVMLAVSGIAHGLIGLFYKYEYSHAYND